MTQAGDELLPATTLKKQASNHPSPSPNPKPNPSPSPNPNQVVRGITPAAMRVDRKAMYETVCKQVHHLPWHDTTTRLRQFTPS